MTAPKPSTGASKLGRDILCITASVKLSTVYNAAREAAGLVKTELPRTTIEVLDSHTATAAEGFVAMAAARAAAKGKDLAEVVDTAKDIRDRVSCAIFLDTIRHIYRSGRIPKVASQVGSALNIKPILTISRSSTL
ncbi:DegV family protein [Chloroflexota bacterium]